MEENNYNYQQNNQIPVTPPIFISEDIVNNGELEKKSIKKEIRYNAVTIGIPTLCLSAIGVLWSFAYLFITMKIFGLSYDKSVEFSQNPGLQQILQIILSCLMFLVPFSIAAKCAGIRLDRTIKFSLPKRGEFLPFLFFGIGFCSFANISISFADSIFQSFGIEYNVDFGKNPTGLFGFLLTFISTAIVPALVEEFACRGIILGLLKKHGEGFAIVTSALVFGIMHGNFEQIPFATMVGLILGYIYVKTNSIWVCVVVHGINNAISVIFTYLANAINVNMQNLLYMVYLIFSLLAAIFGIYLLSKKENYDFKLNKKDSIVTDKQKFTWFFTSWAIIIFVVLNIIEALQYFDLTSIFSDILESAGL